MRVHSIFIASVIALVVNFTVVQSFYSHGTTIVAGNKRYFSSSTSACFAKKDSSDDKRDSKPNKGLWFNASSIPFWPKQIYWRQVFAGSLAGAVIASSVIVAPFLLPLGDDGSSSGDSFGRVGSVSDISKPVLLFQDILLDLQNDYVDEINPGKLFKTGIKAMLTSLDPYTEFEDLKAAKSMQESVSGKYGGVGLVISNNKEGAAVPPTLKQNQGAVDLVPKTDKDNIIDSTSNTRSGSSSTNNKGKGVYVVDAFEGYAYEAGLRAGDRILQVDEQDCTELNVDQVRDLLRGDPDTPVRIKYARDDFGVPARTKAALSIEGTVRTAILDRRLVRLSDVKLATLLGDPEDGIGYINLNGFNGGAGRDFRDALLLLRYAAPNDLNGLILDLRGNPGGLLDMAVEIASYLVPERSDIVSAKSKNGEEVTYRSAIAPIRPPNMRLALLVNQGSASASEIVSGAVQDLDAGVVVGPTRTYGKGLVQKIIPLPYESALKYTIARYYTPSGRCIQGIRYTGGRVTTKAIDAGANAAANNNPDNNKQNPNEKSPLNFELNDKDTRLPLNKKSASDFSNDFASTVGTNTKVSENNLALGATNTDKLYAVASSIVGGADVSTSGLAPVLQATRGTASTTTSATPVGTTTIATNPTISISSHQNDVITNNQDKKNLQSSDNFLTEEDDDTTNNAQVIPDSERRTFFTKFSHRIVRDGGGVEPDIKTVSIQPSISESILYSQGVYNDFAQDYLKKHPIRAQIRKAAIRERFYRSHDPRYNANLWGPSPQQFFVLNDDATGQLQRQRKTTFTAKVGPSGVDGVSKSSTAETDRTRSSNDNNDNDKTFIFNLDQSSYFDLNQRPAEDSMPAYMDTAEQAWYQKLSDNIGTNYLNNKGSVIGASSRVQNSFFWSSEAGFNDAKAEDLYREFRTYVSNKLDQQQLDVEFFVKPQLDRLASNLNDNGLASVVDSVEALKTKLRQAILTDMETNKHFIIDGLECAILSRELPDRLIVYHTVVQDPQVNTAFRLVKGEAVPVTPVAGTTSSRSSSSRTPPPKLVRYEDVLQVSNMKQQ